MGLCSHYVGEKIWSSVCAESQGSYNPDCRARCRQNCTCACLARGGGGGGWEPITVPPPPEHAVRGQTLATHSSQHIQGALLQCLRAAGSKCASSWCCSGGRLAPILLGAGRAAPGGPFSTVTVLGQAAPPMRLGKRQKPQFPVRALDRIVQFLSYAEGQEAAGEEVQRRALMATPFEF